MININLTKSATNFIQKSAKDTKADDMYLRIAVYPDGDNYNYGIGFDEKKDTDLLIKSDNISIILNKKQQELLDEATLDYVKMEDDTMKLIVLNPNDPSFVPPKKDKQPK